MGKPYKLMFYRILPVLDITNLNKSYNSMIVSTVTAMSIGGLQLNGFSFILHTEKRTLHTENHMFILHVAHLSFQTAHSQKLRELGLKMAVEKLTLRGSYSSAQLRG